MNLPKDPVMLLSVINTALRDHYSDLDALCKDNSVSRADLESKLKMIDYHYNKVKNQFV